MDSIVITGGHHSSALPVIKEIKNRYPNIKIYWYGHKHSLQGSKNETLEFKEINELGIPFYNLHAGKFYKTINPIRLLKIPYGFFEALTLLLKHKPNIILSFGGYLGVPVVIAGWFLGICSVSHEQTVVIGYANKVISKFARKILYTWEETLKYLPKHKAVYTGLPLREEYMSSKSEKYKSDNNLPTIYVTAGKTGSHVINMTIYKNLKELLMMANLIHQTGDHSKYKDYEKTKESYEKIKDKVNGKFYLHKFVQSSDVGGAYSQADLVVSRAGAHTTLELLTLNKPCILIPIPWVSHNEQYKNAEVIKDSGLGVIFDEKDLKKEDAFLIKVKEVLNSISSFKSNKPIKDMGNAAALIVDEVEKVVKEKNKV